MRVSQLAPSKSGVTWFWPLMREGETGVDLAKRMPPVPTWAKARHVVIWTKMSAGERAIYLVLIKGKKTVVAHLVG